MWSLNVVSKNHLISRGFHQPSRPQKNVDLGDVHETLKEGLKFCGNNQLKTSHEKTFSWDVVGRKKFNPAHLLVKSDYKSH